MRTPDAAFAVPRLAALYDVFEDDRSDLDAYVAMVEEVGARSVVDIGCGTGSLALLLAERGVDVVGVDPAAASLEVARGKPGAARVRFVDGDATALVALGLQVDMAVMTANVAQVFVTDQDWNETLQAVHACLRPGGWFAFETRRRAARAWENWDLAPTKTKIASGSTVIVSKTVTDVSLPLVTFESTTVLDGETLLSSSTLRFRERSEIERDLAHHGFELIDVRDAPDRPGLEDVFVAQRREGLSQIWCFWSVTRPSDGAGSEQ